MLFSLISALPKKKTCIEKQRCSTDLFTIRLLYNFVLPDDDVVQSLSKSIACIRR